MLLVVSDAAGKEIATGTGFLVSSDGKLITNHHVIEHAVSAVAKAENGGLFPVTGLLAEDSERDLVVLKLDGKDFPSLELGSSEKIESGTRIAVVGNPLGLEGSLSEGIVSGLRLDMIDKGTSIQITAAISPGSSGSPVLNSKGTVIGVASALLRGGQSLNFAIPVEAAKNLLAKTNGVKIIQPLLGLGINHALVQVSFWDDGNRRFVPVIRESPELRLDKDYTKYEQAWHSADYQKALIIIQRMRLRRPEDPDVHFEYGRICRALESYNEALDALQKVVLLRPKDSEAWRDLGEIYLERGRYDDAVAANRKVISLEPDQPYAYFELGIAYARLGKIKQAWAIVGELKKIDEKSAKRLAEVLQKFQ